MFSLELRGFCLRYRAGVPLTSDGHCTKYRDLGDKVLLGHVPAIMAAGCYNANGDATSQINAMHSIDERTLVTFRLICSTTLVVFFSSLMADGFLRVTSAGGAGLSELSFQTVAKGYRSGISEPSSS